PAFLVLQVQQAHAESAQRSLGLLSCSQLRVEHSIVQEEQGKGNDECCAQYVRRDAEQPLRLLSADIQKPLFFVLHLLEQRISLGGPPDNLLPQPRLLLGIG